VFNGDTAYITRHN